MKIIDDLYGEFMIEPVLEELVKCSAVQRLKKIHQGGASYLVNRQWNGTRYEHSVGVMLLIRQLGGTVEEQIAGLLHDVSHTAFSHVIDYVLDEKDENYHEKIFNQVIEQSEIPDILAAYQLDYKQVLFDLSQWKLLEQPLPELCADRIDYTLRDMFTCGNISLREIQAFLTHLAIVDESIFIDNEEAGEWFVDTYYKEVIDYFLDPLNIFGSAVLSKTLKLAITKHIVNPSHFLGNDNEIIDRLYHSNDQEIIRLLNQLHEEVEAIEDDQNFDYYMKQKERMIDPSVWTKQGLVKVSAISEKVRMQQIRASNKAKKGVHIRVIPRGD
ncbi:HD domain-containing protein [Bacillus sp. 1P06AnD]|uniref:HD domain-containing protein n=1 Tax=Bacillus sp. 1P06AnD TaxID=3132208 RepID=UPI0039A284D8